MDVCMGFYYFPGPLLGTNETEMHKILSCPEGFPGLENSNITKIARKGYTLEHG